MSEKVTAPEPGQTAIGAMLKALDAKATKGPWRRCAPLEMPWIIGPNDYRGEGTFTILGGGKDAGYGVLSVPLSLTDGPHEGNAALLLTLRNALPALAAYCDSADALRDDHGLFGTPEANRIAYDTARASLLAALTQGRER